MLNKLACPGYLPYASRLKSADSQTLKKIVDRFAFEKNRKKYLVVQEEFLTAKKRLESLSVNLPAISYWHPSLNRL
jgi:hypothetical protein